MNHHNLLERQIRRHLQAAGEPPAPLAALLAAVSDAYRDADADRLSIERSLELMSAELTANNDQLRRELAERGAIEQALRREQAEQAALILKLEDAHSQLLQSEKMASIGQLAAGVAHEINNPIGFVSSNLGSLRGYVVDLLDILAAYEAHEAQMPEAARHQVAALREKVDLAYLREDTMALLAESADGIRRVRQIVQDLKDFSHVDEAQWHWADLHKGLDSTLNIVSNEIKYVADVVKDYGTVPEVECLASQINQVFMNLLVNAAHAMKDKRGRITIRTGAVSADSVFVEVEDDGTGIAPDNLTRIFDPFFTTKPVGKGTGLGLSLSYGIVQKHGGHIEVRSQVGSGTCFRVCLPVRQTSELAATA